MNADSAHAYAEAARANDRKTLIAYEPQWCPAVDTMMELVAESGLLSSLELVEVNPILDHENETAGLAVELAASALGARIF